MSFRSAGLEVKELESLDSRALIPRTAVDLRGYRARIQVNASETESVVRFYNLIGFPGHYYLLALVTMGVQRLNRIELLSSKA